MGIQISDCTIRDGGYLTNKNFSKEFIEGVLDGLVKAGIDYIETGFLQTQVNGEPIVYHNSKDVQRYISAATKGTEFVGFCDNSRYSNDKLDECDGNSFTSLRISFAKHEWKEAVQFCADAKAKNYHVFVQPLDAPDYTFEERKELIEAVNKIQPEAFAIVDTFGTMHLLDLTRIFKEVDSLLDKNIKIGLHSHNNLCLSCALVEHIAVLADEANRDVVVDSSLFGMGRGAGNACTETVANFLNKKFNKQYDLPILLRTIEKYVLPIKDNLDYGYDMPMFICGETSAHVDNIKYLKNNTDCTIEDMYEVLHLMQLNDRKRYGVGYAKNDFSVLQEMFSKHRK